jgi:uncharacterized cupredoxin-like copper-binding protein
MLPAISRARSRSKWLLNWEGPDSTCSCPVGFETGKLYKLVLRNASNDPHYFTSHAFSQMIFTRKVQVVQQRDGKTVPVAEFKGAIREVEVHPGHVAEWWFVPIATGRAADLQCGIVASDGRLHADHGMVGEIVIE